MIDKSSTGETTTPFAGPHRHALANCGLRWLMIATQITTVIITWPLWNFRSAAESNPSLPLFELPHVSFAWAMIVSALLPLVWRRTGVWVHLAVLLTACCADQFRLQPQFFFNWLLIWAACREHGRQVLRWALAAMWLWAGLHKLLSPEWLGYRSYHFFERGGLGLEDFHASLAVLVGLTEIFVGLLAWRKPKLAAIGCVALHVGIVFLLVLNRQNYSVIPWNLATALMGAVLFWNVPVKRKRWRWEPAIAAVLFASPALFYVGLLDHGFSNVLYSGMIPQGLISLSPTDERTDSNISATSPETITINGWKKLAVPFPKERRLLRQHFEIVAPVGSKLHIFDPRPWLDDQFLVKTADGSAEISRQAFFALTESGPVGIGYQNKQSNFLFDKVNVKRLVRDKGQPIYAIAFEPHTFDRQLLKHLRGFPNLEQIQFAGCDLQDEDLRHLQTHFRLQGIGLTNTKVTDQGLRHLKHLPELHIFETEGTTISGRP